MARDIGSPARRGFQLAHRSTKINLKEILKMLALMVAPGQYVRPRMRRYSADLPVWMLCGLPASATRWPPDLPSPQSCRPPWLRAHALRSRSRGSRGKWTATTTSAGPAQRAINAGWWPLLPHRLLISYRRRYILVHTEEIGRIVLGLELRKS